FTLREMIEPFVIKRAIAQGKPQLLAGQLAAVNQEMEAVKDSPFEFMKRDMEYHTTIVQFMGLGNLNAMWQRVSEDMTRLAAHSIYPRRAPDVIIAEHKELIEALWTANAEKAQACISRHFSIVVDIIREKMTPPK
ncbi:MAG: FCD domain-containing protein, partial [Cloacibacillus sp.]